MEITKDTKVSDILQTDGDIAKVHRVPLDEFLATLRAAVAQVPPRHGTPGSADGL